MPIQRCAARKLEQNAGLETAMPAKGFVVGWGPALVLERVWRFGDLLLRHAALVPRPLKSYVSVLVLIAALSLMQVDALAQTPPPTSGTPSNVVKAGATLTLAPFSFVNEKNENAGFEIDILREATQRLGVELEVVRIPFSQLFSSLNAGIVQIAASGLFMTCERLKNPKTVGRFSVPTFAHGQVISTRTENAAKVKSFDDLVGKKVGVENIGTIADRVVTEAQKKAKFEKVVFTDNPSLFLALEQGRIDAAVQSEFGTLWQIRGNPNVKIAAQVPGTYFPAGFVFRDGDPLREQFNKVLNDMKTDGTMLKIYRNTFKTDPSPDNPVTKVVPEVTLASSGCS